MYQVYSLYKHAYIFQDAPHLENKISHTEAKHLLRHKGLLVRNVYDFDCKEETDFWYVIKDSWSDMAELSTNTRNQIRRGLKDYEIRKFSKEELLPYAFEIYKSAAELYKEKIFLSTEEQLRQRIEQATEDIEFFGAIRKSDLKIVAFSINILQDNTCNYSTIKSLPEDRRHYCMYALFYEMNRYYLTEKKVQYVFDGARSVTNHSNIQPFLIDKFKFRKAYCHLKIYYKWWFKLIVIILYPMRNLIQHTSVRGILEMHGMQN